MLNEHSPLVLVEMFELATASTLTTNHKTIHVITLHSFTLYNNTTIETRLCSYFPSAPTFVIMNVCTSS